MDTVEHIRTEAADPAARVVFPEGDDPRVQSAAGRLAEKGICLPVLIGSKTELPGVEWIAPGSEEVVEELLPWLESRRPDEKQDRASLRDPLTMAVSLVGSGRADCCVAGAVHPTAAVLRAALRHVGVRSGAGLVSSIFLMGLSDGTAVTFGDCGVVPYPDADQLADIAVESARSHRLLTGTDPRVAMLSFSTMGSADHERVELVRRAMKIAREKSPALPIDGELQFDAAFVPDIGRRKAPGSPVAGRANVFIFPNLDAGNIGYKIAERIGGATATGPILQGLQQPVMDLSRGCGTEDIVNAACAGLILGKAGPG